MSITDIDFLSITGAVQGWAGEHLFAVLIIIGLAFVVQFALGIFLEKLIRRLIPRGHFTSKRAEEQRENTLIHIMGGTLRVIVWVMAGLMILSEVGVDIGPLLAAAGVAGIAIGFGGQYLIRDVVAGLFIIIENQYRVDDVVCLDDTCGLVEDVSIRMATLRDLDGTVHHIPHGTVTKVSNLSKEFARINLDIGVSYSSDLEKVIEVINAVGEELAADTDWKEHIKSAPKFERVDAFGDSAIIVKVLGDTEPLQQWAVAGEFRKRLKIAFDKADIEIPFPQRVIHQG